MKKNILSILLLFFAKLLFSQTINVSTATQLQNALNVAQAGQTIVLANGSYVKSGGFVVPSGIHGTQNAPIILLGNANTVLSSGNLNSGYALGLGGNNYWKLKGFTVRNSKKGIVIDQSKYTTIENVRVTKIGEEGIHLRTYSSFDTIKNCFVDTTGLVSPGFGEALYVGSAESNWATYTNGNPDTCNYNVLINNAFGNFVAAENIDIKEGTKRGKVSNNAFNGAGLSNVNAADSWIDVKGNYYKISNNTGVSTLTDGFQTHIATSGWGNFNTFSNNTLTVNTSNYGINVQTSNALGTAGNNIVCNNNIANGATLGLTNVTVTSCIGNERALYVDGFNVIINSAASKTALLQYAKNHQITYLILYDLHLVHNQHNLTMASTNQILANFISDAKQNYGITKIAAAGENAWFFQNRIIAYNSTRSVPNEKFDVLGMEFEFWTPSLTNTGGVYCDDYLTPGGLPCDSTGAFAFCKDQLMQMRTMANASSHPLTVEMYVGWPNSGQLKIIANLMDRVLIHAYVTNPNTAFTYALTRLNFYSTFTGIKNVSIIYSAEPNFMQPWLTASNLVNAENIFNTAYNASSGTWKSHVNMTGFTYFTYSYMTNIALPLQLIDFQGIKINEKDNQLSWRIAEAQNINRFEVEKSNDGVHFFKLKNVIFEAKNNFDFVEKDVLEAAFYRLKIVENDGRFSYSNIIFIHKNKSKSEKISVFPNPTKGILYVNTIEKNVSFQIFNSIGALILEGEELPQTFDLQAFPKGIYFLSVGEDKVKFVLD